MGAMRPSLAPVPIRELILDAVAALDRSQRSRVRVSDASAEVTVSCDRRLVRRLLLNLLSNALKYSPDGESVEVGLSVEPGTVTVRVVDQRHRSYRGRAGARIRSLCTVRACPGHAERPALAWVCMRPAASPARTAAR